MPRHSPIGADPWATAFTMLFGSLVVLLALTESWGALACTVVAYAACWVVLRQEDRDETSWDDLGPRIGAAPERPGER